MKWRLLAILSAMLMVLLVLGGTFYVVQEI